MTDLTVSGGKADAPTVRQGACRQMLQPFACVERAARSGIRPQAMAPRVHSARRACRGTRHGSLPF